MVDRAVIILSAKDQASNVFKRLGSNIIKTLRSSPIAAAVSFGALTFAITKATKAAIDFEKGIAEIKTLGVNKPIAQIRQDVDRLSKSFGQQPRAVIEAYYNAISAGVKESNVSQFLTEASTLALAGATDISVATDLLTGLRSVFTELTDRQLAQFANATKNLGKTTIPELAGALGRVAPTAAELGVSLLELSAAFAVVTIKIGDTNQTASALKALLAAVAKPSTQAAEQAEKLGIAFSAQALKAKGLAGFLEDLVPAVEGNITAQITLFGSIEAFNAVAAIAANKGEDFKDALAGIREEIDTGALQKAADLMKDTAAVRLEILQAEFASLTRIITLQLLPGITEFAKGLTDIINLATGDVFERNLVDPLRNLGGEIRGIEDEINILRGTFKDAIPIAVQAQIKEMQSRLADLGLEFRQIASKALPEMEEQLVSLANKLIQQGIPFVDAYNQAIKQLSISQLKGAADADKKTKAEEDAAAAAKAAAAATQEQFEAIEELPAIGGFFEDFSVGVETLVQVQEKLTAIRDAAFELGAALQLATDPITQAELGEQFIAQADEIIKAFGGFENLPVVLQESFARAIEAIDPEAVPNILENLVLGLDPDLTAEAITNQLIETFPEIDFELLAEESEFFKKLFDPANAAASLQEVFDVVQVSTISLAKNVASGLAAVGGAISGATEGSKKIAKVALAVNSALGIADAAKNFADGIQATANFDPRAVLFFAAQAANIVASSISLSQSAKLQAGGLVPNLPGASPNEDSVRALLQPGELVVPKPFVEEFRGLLGMSQSGAAFQEGGIVGEAGIAGRGAVSIPVTVLPTTAENVGLIVDAINDGVERLGFRAVASEVL